MYLYSYVGGFLRGVVVFVGGRDIVGGGRGGIGGFWLFFIFMGILGLGREVFGFRRWELFVV